MNMADAAAKTKTATRNSHFHIASLIFDCLYTLLARIILHHAGKLDAALHLSQSALGRCRPRTRPDYGVHDSRNSGSGVHLLLRYLWVPVRIVVADICHTLALTLYLFALGCRTHVLYCIIRRSLSKL
jgi:hypothetical protein